MNITARSANLLRDKLAQIYTEAFGLETVSINPKACSTVRDRIVDTCFESGIGFRLVFSGQDNFTLTLDRKCKGDVEVEAYGLRLFLDPLSAAYTEDYELDYLDKPTGVLVLQPRPGQYRQGG